MVLTLRGCQPPAKRSGLTVTLTFFTTSNTINSPLKIEYYARFQESYSASSGVRDGPPTRRAWCFHQV